MYFFIAQLRPYWKPIKTRFNGCGKNVSFSNLKAPPHTLVGTSLGMSLFRLANQTKVMYKFNINFRIQKSIFFVWSTLTVDVDGCIFLSWQQAALFITPHLSLTFFGLPNLYSLILVLMHKKTFNSFRKIFCFSLKPFLQTSKFTDLQRIWMDTTLCIGIPYP